MASTGLTADSSEVTEEVHHRPAGPDHHGAARTGPARRVPFLVAVGGVALAGLVWKVAYIAIWKRPADACGVPLCGDAIYYNAQAQVIADGRWFDNPFHPGMPAADHPPLTSLVMAPVSWISGDRLTAERLAMALIGALVVVAIGYLGRRVVGDRRGYAVGVIAAVIAAVNANLWMNDALVMSETIAALCITLTLLLTYRFVDDPTWGRAAALGAVCGVTVLARAEMAMFIPIVVLPVACFARSLPRRDRLLRFGLVAVVAVAVLVPWTAYNATRFDRPVLISTNDGLTLIGANCPSTYYGGAIGFWDLGCREPAVASVPAGADQSIESAEFRRQAVDYIRANRNQLPAVAWARVRRVWNLYEPGQMVWFNQGEGRERWASWLGVCTADALVLLSLPGAVVLWKRRRSVWPLLATAVLTSITALAFYGISRFRLPADIAMCVLAAVAVHEGAVRGRRWWDGWRRDRRQRAALRSSPDDDHQAEPAVPELSAGTHFPCLDAYRGIGMTMVLLNHAAYATGYIQRAQSPEAPALERILGPVIARFDISVPMFFVMSAFLLYRPFARAALTGRGMPDIRTFFRRRILRVFPAYWVALIGIGILFGLQIATWRGWIANAFVLQSFGVPAEVCNGDTCRVAYGITQAWSIGVEVTFYLFLPLFAWLAHRLVARWSGGARLLGLLGCCAVLYAVGTGFRLYVVGADPGWAHQSLLWLPMFLDIFAIGMALAAVSAAVADGWRLPSGLRSLGDHQALCWTVAALVVFVIMTRFSPPREPFGLNGAEYVPRQFVYGLASALWLWPAMFGNQTRGRLRAFLASGPMVYLGAISLSFYLWHLNIIEQVKDWTVPGYSALQELARHPPPDNPLAGVATFQGNYLQVAVISWVLSFLVASLLFRWVELPFLRLKDRPLRDLLRRPPPEGSAPTGPPDGHPGVAGAAATVG